MLCIKCKAEIPEYSLYCPLCGKKQSATQRQAVHARGNGTGSAYRRGKTWECAVVLGYKVVDGRSIPVRRTKGGFRTKKEALDYIPQLKSERSRKSPTLQVLYDQFRDARYKKLSASRQEKYDIAWKKMEAVKYAPIDLLTTADLQSVINAKGPTYYTARDIRDLFSLLYQAAMADQFVPSNLADFLVLPDLVETEKSAFTHEEIQQLWQDYGAGNWWTGYILLMAYTGMMPGELLAARKSSIDWDGHKIQGAGKKTKVRKDTPIALADFIIPVLQDLCQHTPGEKLIAINKDNFYKVYYATLERAGCRKLRPYDCRHTAATALAKENIPASVIQRIMRHANFATTQQYIHIDMEPMLDAVNRLDKSE